MVQGLCGWFLHHRCAAVAYSSYLYVSFQSQFISLQFCCQRGVYYWGTNWQLMKLKSDSNVHILMGLLIDKGLASGALSERQGILAQVYSPSLTLFHSNWFPISLTLIGHSQVTNLFVLLLTPIAIFNMWGTDVFSLIGATVNCFCYCVVFLKLWSYGQVSLSNVCNQMILVYGHG